MNKKREYAWVIFAVAILMKIGGGAIYATTSNFVAPVVKDFGCQVNQFTMITSIEAIGMALFYTTAAKVLTTKKIGIVMGIASLCEVIGVGLMGVYKSVQGFYFSAALIGVAQAFTGFVALPILMNMWFKKNYGTVYGIVMGVNSASTMLFSLLSGQLITSLGWRKAYFVLSAIAFIVMIPAIFLFIKSPEEKGVLPYGAEEESAEEGAVPKEEWGLTRKEAFTKFAFWAAWATCLCYSIGSCANGYIVPFTTMELGQSVNYGARVGMFSSIGGILCSFILGRINDKFGSKAGMLWGAVTTVLGFVIVIMSIGNTDLVMLGSFVVGLGSSMYGVQCPILAKEVLGDKHFSSVWSIMMTANSLIGGGLYSSFALFYDIGGTYRGAFITGAILYVLALVVGSLSINSAKSYKPDSVK